MRHCMLVQSSAHCKLNKCTNSTAKGTATNQQSNTTKTHTTNTLKVKEEGLIHFGNVENLFSFLFYFIINFISCLRNLNIFTYFFLMLNFFFVAFFLLIHKIISIFIFFYIINLIISPKMREKFCIEWQYSGCSFGSRNCIKIEILVLI